MTKPTPEDFATTLNGKKYDFAVTQNDEAIAYGQVSPTEFARLVNEYVLDRLGLAPGDEISEEQAMMLVSSLSVSSLFAVEASFDESGAIAFEEVDASVEGSFLATVVQL